MSGRNRLTRRYWALLQSAGIGLLVAGLGALGLVAVAGATTPASGDQVTTAAQCSSSCTAAAPFSSGQTINIVIPANSAFAAPDNTTSIKVIECAAPNGVIPTQTTACDGNTIQGPTVTANTDGSFTLSGYTVYALPDSVSLGEGGTGVTCGATAATECILYIGNNQNDFTAPHLWSQFFFIQANGTDSGANPGDGSAAATAHTPTAANSTVVPSPTTLPADGVNSSTVTVTLKDSANTPVSGKAVTLSPNCTPTPCSTHITGPSSAQTDTNGQTTFTVTDTAAQSVSLTATDTTDSVPLTPASVTFQAPATSAANSSVAANPTNPPADGTTPTTITVTLRDQGTIPQPIAGDTVTLADGTGHAVITPAATPDKTNAQGVATFTATDNSPESVTFTATDTTASTVITNTAAVTFGTLAVSKGNSTVTATSPAPLGALGTTAVVTLLTSGNSPVSGKAVSLQASGSATVGAPSAATTGSNGQVSFKVTDTVAETVTLTATDTTDGITITQTAQVVFANPSASATMSNVLASGTTSPADGETFTLIRVILSDQFGNPVAGKTTTLAGSPGGNVQIHPVAVGGTGTPGV
ncbi:MAG TPA: Ig-like domain-containing protein, partial [Mycobacterium sp.]